MTRAQSVWAWVSLLVACGGTGQGGADGTAEMAGTVIRARPGALAMKSATGDPCDFTTGRSFGYDQVLACYRSVPWCPDPSNPATCDRDAQVSHFRQAVDGFTDLAESYEARNERLDRISRTRFRGDFDQFTAFSELFAEFRNDHWTYFGPQCFELAFFEFIPLNFGSMLVDVGRGRGKQQIIYLRNDTPEGGGAFDLPLFFGDFYREETGIDTQVFAGQRVLGINGEEAFEFLLRWGRHSLRQDEDDGINLMSILDEAGYLLRSGSFNPFPESPSITLDLVDGAGRRTRVEFPWLFVRFALPPTASTAEFQALCFEPSTPASASALAAASRTGVAERILHGQRLAQRRMIVSGAERAVQTIARHTERPPYSEVPPERLNQDVVELFPQSNGARTVAYLDDTVAFQIRGDFVSNWEPDLDQAARYACDNAQRFVLDVRGNVGGFVRRLVHMAHYLRATEPSVPSSVMVHRELVNAPMRNELRALSEQLAALGFPPCTLGYEAECSLAVPSGELVTDPLWYLDSRLERRGHVLERLSPQVTYAGYPIEDFVIPCPGKFVGKNLVVLMNGLNTSAGYFGPELLRGLGTLVVQGGQAGESMTTGRARGGPVLNTAYFSGSYDFLAQTLGVTPHFNPPALPRPVEFRLEYDGAYRADLRTLHVENPPVGDVQVAFWSNSIPTDGAAYRAAISAVEIRAVVEPACGPARRARSCRRYEACAADALHRAVQDGLLGAITAERALEDLGARCEDSG